MAGRWDGAVVRLLTIDWEAPDGETLVLARGELGAVSVEGAGFTAELKGPAAVLERPVSELTSPECRARFGDTRCRVDLVPHSRITSISAVIDAVTVMWGALLWHPMPMVMADCAGLAEKIGRAHV